MMKLLRIQSVQDLNKHACITYRNYFGDDYLQEDNITEIDKTTIQMLNILIAGFSCQAFSIAGYHRGFNDDRGNVYFQILEILEAQEQEYDQLPQAIIPENVNNLLSHDGGILKNHLKLSAILLSIPFLAL